MAALALASDAPTEDILDRQPPKRSAPLISIVMWKLEVDLIAIDGKERVIDGDTFMKSTLMLLICCGP